MGDSTSFGSLLALVDNHLSKTSLTSINAGNKNGLIIPSFSLLCNTSGSDTQLPPPSQRFIIPSLNSNGLSIPNILAEQTANALKAKELRLQKEQQLKELEQKIETNKVKNDDKDYVIDLTEALSAASLQPLKKCNSKSESLSNSLESLDQVDFTDYELQSDSVYVKDVKKVTILPCLLDNTTTTSYLLRNKIRQKKVSSFGRVLCTRYRQVAAPYIKEKIHTSIKIFDFSTPSPDEIAKDRFKKAPAHDIFTTLGLEKSESLKSRSNSECDK